MGMMYRLFLVPTKPHEHQRFYLYIQEKDGLHICPSFRVACSFPDFEHETDKAKYAYLDRLAILHFDTEPPIGVAKVLIINENRIVF